MACSLLGMNPLWWRVEPLEKFSDKFSFCQEISSEKTLPIFFHVLNIIAFCTNYPKVNVYDEYFCSYKRFSNFNYI